jgi:hypothetical protein
MTLRQHIDKFLNKYLPHPPAVVVPTKLTKKQIDHMPAEVYRFKLMTEPGFKSQVEAALAESRVKYYSSDARETVEMVVDPKTTIRGFGRG